MMINDDDDDDDHIKVHCLHTTTNNTTLPLLR